MPEKPSTPKIKIDDNWFMYHFKKRYIYADKFALFLDKKVQFIKTKVFTFRPALILCFVQSGLIAWSFFSDSTTNNASLLLAVIVVLFIVNNFYHMLYFEFKNRTRLRKIVLVSVAGFMIFWQFTGMVLNNSSSEVPYEKANVAGSITIVLGFIFVIYRSFLPENHKNNLKNEGTK